MLTREPMRTRFILRFDDICPTMNWRVWRLLEHDLYELNIKPLMAGLPENPEQRPLVNGARADDFWKSWGPLPNAGRAVGFHGVKNPKLPNRPRLCGMQS